MTIVSLIALILWSLIHEASVSISGILVLLEKKIKTVV